MILRQVIGGSQPMKGGLATKNIASGTQLGRSPRRRPRRLEPADLEPNPPQKVRAGMGTLKHAGFSKARQEVSHLSRLAKRGAPPLALLLSEKSAIPFGTQKAMCTIAQESLASYVQAARSGIPIGTPDWALPPRGIPIGTPDWALPPAVGHPDSLKCKASST
eukprot:6463615-Amphidinium_carterae.1